MERIKKTKMKIVFFYFKHINHSIKFVFSSQHQRKFERSTPPPSIAWALGAWGHRLAPG